ncbi:phosphofurin acidic cluster sorting protein 1-like [Cimex lectularius]|uniref:Phosphofurin acidic cluster sorting protein 1/2 N-terminal C2 domain-containing protein n=1 Tax=Cimex lectularius TaxID=79782 RepID=A0A8I6S8R3_CIMLE|nr:phosphofurin acidic cluster sorting protein 1-like [Cimex lectularius]
MREMSDKNKTSSGSGTKPVPMKLFATWEVDRTPSNCIPRLCSLTLTRLVLLKSLGADVNSISIAVKMQGSKRTLRSNEVALPANALLDTELQLNFSLQYPHILKREGNKLHIMIQRRKRYKNRTILGYKTLAIGLVNMCQVLQRQLDLELDLLSDLKESKGHSCVLARVSVSALNSQPVDYELTTKTPHGRLGRLGEFSDEDEEFSSNDEGSDSEPMLEERRRKSSMPQSTARQRNFKQKFISLLKKFRANEDLHGLGTDREVMSSKLSQGDMDPAEIEDLFEELDLSDSGPEQDTISISSNPKPSLRPFFSSSRSLLQDSIQGSDMKDDYLRRADGILGPGTSSPPKNEKSKKEISEGEKEKKKKKSDFLAPKNSLLKEG